jgi:2-dehydro-3-deoxyglucarate aldolase
MNIKEKLDKNSYLVGSWINTASPIVAELMASTGFDYLAVDAEHSAVDLAQTQVLFQAMSAGNPECAPFVRLPGNRYDDTKRYMDAGAKGIIAPLINTGEQARELVRAVKYPPYGERGVGFCRANSYGMRLKEAVESSHLETFICVQVEHVQAIENINEILSVEGVDAVMIGPYDLSASMGITAQFEHPDMVKAIKQVYQACQKHSVVPGIHVVQPDVDEVKRRYEEGFRFIAYSLDITMLMQSCLSGLGEIRKILSDQENE